MKMFLLFLLVLLTSSPVLSQNNNIVNKLGPGGYFSIGEANNTYFTVSEQHVHILSNLTLGYTYSSAEGVIYKGYSSFIHDYSVGGGENVFIGANSGNFTMTSAAVFNTALGPGTLNANTTGYRNTAVGQTALLLNTDGFENTSVGAFSLNNNTSGNQNTALGFNALQGNTTANQNTAVGHHSLENSNGNYNTALGYNAGSTVTTGANLTLIGIDANPSSPTAIDQITLGNTFVNSLRCNVQNISSLSDQRDKKNIRDLDLGIGFLMKLKPRLFNWDKREWYPDNKTDGSKMKETPTAGFIAQELDQTQLSENAEWLNLVLKDNPEKLEATPGNLLPVIVKAIQDLKKENDELKKLNANLDYTVAELINRLNRLEQIQNESVQSADKPVIQPVYSVKGEK